MLDWVSRKLTRSWKGLAAKLRRWGDWGLGGTLGVTLPVFLFELTRGFGLHTPGPILKLLAPVATVIGGVAALSLLAGTLLARIEKGTQSARVAYDAPSRALRFEHGKGMDTVPLTEIAHARFYEPEEGEDEGALHIESRTGREWVLKMTAADARAVLAATRLGPRQNVSRLMTSKVSSGLWFILGGPLFVPALALATYYISSPLFYAHMAGWLDMAAPSPMLILAVAILGMPLIGLQAARGVAALLRPIFGKWLDIGGDGIAFGTWLGRQFIAYRDIESIEIPKVALGTDEPQSTLVIRTHEGEEHRIRLDAPEGDLGRTVRARLDAALEQRDEVLMPKLERGERTEEQWRKALSALVDERASYRQATVSRSEVLKVLQNEMAPPEQRLGAAVALANTKDIDAKRVLVKVSEATLDPELRGPLVKIARVAQADIEVEEEVLAANSTDEPTSAGNP